jgi:hypothetical protein
MYPTRAEFGTRLFSKQGPPAGGNFWVGMGVLLLAMGGVTAVRMGIATSWEQLLSEPFRAQWVIGGLGLFCVCLGVRQLRRTVASQHYYELGACHERGRETRWLAYGEAEQVTYQVRTVRGRPERSLDFAGPGGEPRFQLWAVLTDGEPADGETATFAQIDNVATRAVKAVAEKFIARVDRGEVVKWTGSLWLDPAGLRVGDPANGKFVPWGAVDGVKDGAHTGRIEVYAFGGAQPVAAATTFDANALPGLQAFMHLLDRGQAAAKAA